MNRNLLVCLAFAVACIAPASADPAGSVMATVNGALAQTNADNAAALNSYFTPTSVVVDDLPPFVWNGANAAERWWSQLDAFMKTAHIVALHATSAAPTRIVVVSDHAYVVVPLTIASLVNGKPVRHRGYWTLVLQRVSGTWKIASATFSSRP
jgi:ketosteroid isomerase-like protein